MLAGGRGVSFDLCENFCRLNRKKNRRADRRRGAGTMTEQFRSAESAVVTISLDPLSGTVVGQAFTSPSDGMLCLVGI